MKVLIDQSVLATERLHCDDVEKRYASYDIWRDPKVSSAHDRLTKDLDFTTVNFSLIDFHTLSIMLTCRRNLRGWLRRAKVDCLFAERERWKLIGANGLGSRESPFQHGGFSRQVDRGPVLSVV